MRHRKIPPTTLRRAALGGVAAAAVVGLVASQVGPFSAGASSHREAPLIAGDPRADNTDVYAFVSPDAPDTVTLISDWIPFEEPNGGPNFYTWADDTRYNIKIDNDGDALPDLTYTWIFDTVVRDGANQFLYNTGPITSLDDPNLNVYQTYDLTVTDGNGNTTVLLGNGDGVASPGDPIAAPSIVGPASTPDYAKLRSQATYAVPGGGQTYAGQADDPFFLDLRVFDVLYGGERDGGRHGHARRLQREHHRLAGAEVCTRDQRRRHQEPGDRDLEHDRPPQRPGLRRSRHA